MVKYADDTPTSTITVQGLSFEVPQPYKAGDHTLTEGEASALNQTLAENLRNNFAPAIKKAQEEYRKANSLGENDEVGVDQLDKDALAASFETYATEYEFGVRRAGGGSRLPSDPVEREAYKLAQDKVKDALKGKNVKLDSVSREQMDGFIQGVLAKYPAIREEAQRRVSATQSIALDELV